MAERHDNIDIRYIIITFIIFFVAFLYGCKGVNTFTGSSSEKAQNGIAKEKELAQLQAMQLTGYYQAVGEFSQVQVEDLSNMIDEHADFYLYVGRPTCKWCRKVVPALSSAFQSQAKELFYLDSTDSESNETIKSFRQQYGIETVPAVLHFYNNGSWRALEIDLDANDIREAIKLALENED